MYIRIQSVNPLQSFIVFHFKLTGSDKHYQLGGNLRTISKQVIKDYYKLLKLGGRKLI